MLPNKSVSCGHLRRVYAYPCTSSVLRTSYVHGYEESVSFGHPAAALRQLRYACSSALPGGVAVVGMVVTRNRCPADTLPPVGRLGGGLRCAGGGVFLSIGVKSASFIDYLCDDLIAKNILPRDSFFHKWVLGPVFAIPFSIANGMLLATGSLYGVLLLYMLLYAALALWRTELSMRYAKHKRSAYIVWLFWVWLAKTVVWLTLTSMVVYIKLCMNVEYTVYSMCAPHVQRRIYAANRESVRIDLITDERNNYDIERYDASPRPYSDLAYLSLR